MERRRNPTVRWNVPPNTALGGTPLTTIDAAPPSLRSALVAEIRQRLDHETFPRLIVLIMLVFAGAASFLCSALTLDAGMASMAGRYALAAASGYFVFLGLVRVWIAVRRGWWPNPDDEDVSDAIETAGNVKARVARGTGDSLVDAAAGGVDWPFDLDDMGWLAVVVLAAGAGILAVWFVVYSAPVLLAEVALDAALVGTVYRRLREQDRGYWAATALRRTWVSAAVIVAFMAGLGFALQQLSPDAVSIGDVARQFFAR